MKFGRLTVLSREENHKYFNIKSNKLIQQAQFLCQCECGNKIIVKSFNLLSGTTKSCGCIMKEILIKRNLNRKKNNYNLLDEYGIGYTSKGEEFYFDLEDYNKIKDYTWCYTPKKISNN